MIKALILDLDGTILENEQDWEEAFAAVGVKNNIPKPESGSTENGWWHEPGIGIGPNWNKLLRDKQLAEKLAHETWVLYWDKFKQSGTIKLRAGTEEIIQKAKDRGWQVALCTGSSWNVVEPELEQLELYVAFDVTTTGEEVLVLKPDPEIYTLTAQKLNVEPEDCLVIEDAIAGVRAAIDAGMKSVGLVSEYASAAIMEAAGASYVVKDFTSVSALIDRIE